MQGAAMRERQIEREREYLRYEGYVFSALYI